MNKNNFDIELKLLVDCLLNKYSKAEVQKMTNDYFEDLQENDSLTNCNEVVNIIDFMYKRYEPTEDICGLDIAECILSLVED